MYVNLTHKCFAQSKKRISSATSQIRDRLRQQSLEVGRMPDEERTPPSDRLSRLNVCIEVIPHHEGEG